MANERITNAARFFVSLVAISEGAFVLAIVLSIVLSLLGLFGLTFFG